MGETDCLKRILLYCAWRYDLPCPTAIIYIRENSMAGKSQGTFTRQQICLQMYLTHWRQAYLHFFCACPENFIDSDVGVHQRIKILITVFLIAIFYWKFARILIKHASTGPVCNISVNTFPYAQASDTINLHISTLHLLSFELYISWLGIFIFLGQHQ
jgi:hypothetical protein